MIGKIITHYQITEKIGEGGMGVVYKARDIRLDRPVAIKVLSAEKAFDPDRKRRFVQEAKAASALNHPNIITIYDIDQTDGRDFIAMEFVSGKTLDELIPTTGIRLSLALKYAVRIADALAKAHSAGIVHRDLKPSNIMVNDDGIVKILDFGLAKLTEQAQGNEFASTATVDPGRMIHTEKGAIVGTVGYMSPEQAEGKTVAPSSDIFSFGSVLYEMVTGRKAFQGDTILSTILAILNKEPAPLGTDIPSEMEKTVTRCLCKDPAKRYQNGSELRSDLERLEQDSGFSGRLAAVSTQKKSIKIPIAIISIILLISAGLLLWKFYQDQHTKTEQSHVVSDVKNTPKTIAVLPFENLSSEKDQEYFADGIAEELLNDLTRISELEVRGRTSSFYFKGKNENLQTISKMLDVEYILEGSVRKVDKKVRITVQLINTREDKHLWSETYDRTMDDIFAIQDAIAQSVANAMQITLGVGELGNKPGMTRNIAAYDAYLAGLSFYRNLGRENMTRAIEQLEKAVAIDPDFAIGWDVLSNAYNSSNTFIPEKSEEYRQKAIAADSRVIELIPESDLALEIKASRSGDRVEIERLYKKAITLNPTYYDLYGGYGGFLFNVGRPTEAVVYLERYRQSDPLRVGAYLLLGDTYDLLGNFDASSKAFKKARELTREPLIYNAALLAIALEMNNRALIDEYVPLVSDIEAYGKNGISDSFDINKAMYHLLDNPEKAVNELRLHSTDPAFKNSLGRIAITIWASYFGDHEFALRIYKENGSPIFTMWRPIHKEMRRLPGFKDFVRETGLVDYWRKSGNWGDFCHPASDNDFECE